MRKLSLLLVLVLAFGVVSQAYAVHIVNKDLPDDVIQDGINFINNIKWDQSKLAEGKFALTIPKVDEKKYTIMIHKEFMDKDLSQHGYHLIHQGTGGITTWQNVLTNYDITGVAIVLGHVPTGLVVTKEVYIYKKGGKAFEYLPIEKRVYPVKDKNGNIIYWSDDQGAIINADGSPLKYGDKVIPFRDIAGHWASEVIVNIFDRGYIKGYPDATFKPDGNVTRAEFAAMFSNLVKDKYSEARTYNNAGMYHDVSGHWGEPVVNKLLSFMTKEDVINIFGADFKPDQKITREEVVAVIHAILKDNDGFEQADFGINFTDLNNTPFVAAINFGVANGFIAGYPDGTFRPDGNITRAEMSAILVTVLEVKSV